jgi:hypothetical protein
MTKKRVNKDLIQQRINQKLKLLEMHPNAVVYEFNNPTIRTNFRVPARVLALADNAFKEYWGFKIERSDIEALENIINNVYEKAMDVIELANELGKNLVNFDINSLKNMRKIEKEKIIENNRNQVEVIIPHNDKFEMIYDAIIYIDKYDLPIKQNRTIDEVEKWIAAVKDFGETIKKAESDVTKLTAEKLNPRDLGRYKALRNNVIRYLKAIEDTKEDTAAQTAE